MIKKALFIFALLIFLGGALISARHVKAQLCPYTESLTTNSYTCPGDLIYGFTCVRWDYPQTYSCFESFGSCITVFEDFDCVAGPVGCAIDLKLLTVSCGPLVTPTPGPTSTPTPTPTPGPTATPAPTSTPTPTPAPFCGDGSCSGLEDCSTCSIDCGVCPACTEPIGLIGAGLCDLGGLLDITWTWSSVGLATSYRIQVDDDAFFGSPDVNVTTGLTSYASNNLASGTWYARVRVETSTGLCTAPSAYSTTQSVSDTCASCSLTLPPSYPVGAGDTAEIVPAISALNANISNVEFTVPLPAAIASVCADETDGGTSPCLSGSDSYIDGVVSYRANLTGYLANQSTTVTATATLDDPAATQCSDTAIINVANPDGWWQVVEGDCVAGGSISSNIPGSCDLGFGCDPVLITGDPGVPTYTTSLNPGSPSISSTNWNADSSVAPSAPNYAFFESRIPSILAPVDPGGTSDGTIFVTGGTFDGEYYWFSHSGDVLINNAFDVTNRKVVLFVDGDLTIGGNINLDDGQGLFLAIVSGDITVSATAGGAEDSGPHLEGVFYAQNTFTTEAGANQLHLRGSVAANNYSLQRDLADNSQDPAEIFEYGADQVMAFPKDLTRKRLIWREVAP